MANIATAKRRMAKKRINKISRKKSMGLKATNHSRDVMRAEKGVILPLFKIESVEQSKQTLSEYNQQRQMLKIEIY